MTDLLTGSDGGALGHWLSVAELAKLKGLSRQTVTEKIDRLEREGKLQTRREGRSRLVELATYDRIVGQVGDASREIGAESKRGGKGQLNESGALRDSQAVRAQYEAKLKALDYAERTGQLVPVKGDHGVEAALMKVGDKVLRDLGAPMTWIDEIMSAARISEPELRRLMRRKITELRQQVANNLLQIAGDATAAENDGSVQIDLHFDGDE
jgi:DNA-binding transcriptional ArsR family regulator